MKDDAKGGDWLGGGDLDGVAEEMRRGGSSCGGGMRCEWGWAALGGALELRVVIEPRHGQHDRSENTESDHFSASTIKVRMLDRATPRPPR